jgi:prophage maintenance system killer protein
MHKISSSNTGSIVIYKPEPGKETLDVRLKQETVWLNLDQMAHLFGRDKSVISRHIKNVFTEKELCKKAVVANFATTAADGKTYQVDYYNLDVIISVGYRVKSQNGVRFRIWATDVLRNHIVKGYTLNHKRISQLQEKQLSEFADAVSLIKKTIETKQLSTKEESGLLKVITEYANSWILLQQYDKGKIAAIGKTTKTTYKLEYTEAQNAITQLKGNLIAQKEASGLFGIEKHKGLDQIVSGLYQTFGRKQLYPSVEGKAAHLLYFIIKDHPFSDGNKRIASFLFIVFLARNNCLFRKNGERKINDNTLVALALLVAESEAKQKDIMIKLVMNFLTE